MDTLAAQVGALLKSHGLMLATAESCTGGGVAQAITGVAGSSVWFERGFVTYSNLSKQQMLGVRESTLRQHGAVSEMTVREMVAGALQHSAAQLALAVSGIAGPDGGTAGRHGVVCVGNKGRRGPRAAISARWQSCRSARPVGEHRLAGSDQLVESIDRNGLRSERERTFCTKSK
jgi:nicotinamide-nucleotide amidase